KGNVTISTNMAGRGTDIVLGDGVKELGGLHVIGTERHESRRIDNQLRGRAGRQGDQGSSRFYVSLEDDLMKLFGSGRISGMMERLGIEEDVPIEHRLISRAIENAQKKVEEYHFGIRKQVLEFDDVMNKQRETIYALRRKILEGRELKEKIFEMQGQMVDEWMGRFLPEKIRPEEWDMEGLVKTAKEMVAPFEMDFNFEEKKREDIKEILLESVKHAYLMREEEVSSDIMREIERNVLLRVIDTSWIEQLHNMDVLREGIGLRGWGGRDPLIEYKIEGYTMFQEMMHGIREQVNSMILKVQLAGEENLPKRRKNLSYGPREAKVKAVPVTTIDKIGRNDPCPCGSGKKYKKCCQKS
ncbi:MAG: SEC-C metal-binding domain-containing protein, partial [Candidatus Margulisiibacteriota bacterium]